MGFRNSIAIDSNNKVHISYYGYWDSDLKYATNASGSWTIQTIDSSGSLHNPSIAIDSNNKVHISYYDYSNRDLKYATNAYSEFYTVPSGTHYNYSINLGDRVSATFSQIEGPCIISKEELSPPLLAPSGYKFVDTIYDITNTGCPINGTITVTIQYDETSFSGPEENLKLFHWENSEWKDITTSVNTVNNTITGICTSLSPFGIGYPYSISGYPPTPIGKYTTGANENMIALIAIIAILGGVFILGKRDCLKKSV